MAGIYWDRQNYNACESVFRNSAEFCSEHEVWRLNVAHTFFMQDNHYREAIRYQSCSTPHASDWVVLWVVLCVRLGTCRES